MPRERRIYDISASLCRSLPVWPGADRFSLTWLKTLRDDGVNESAISLNSHTGTHLDTPRHFIEGGRGLDGIPIERLVGPAFVLEFDGTGDVDAETRSGLEWDIGADEIPPTPRVMTWQEVDPQ